MTRRFYYMTITVIIATSFKRTTWVLERSLLSVYLQKNCNPKKISVIVVDDNSEGSEIEQLKKGIDALRERLEFQEEEFRTQILKNSRTRYMSGTGAWNTGILESYKTNPEGYVAILDDDDEYLENHLSDCIEKCTPSTVAVFQSLYWLHSDGSTMKLPLYKEQLTPQHFYIGNPGVQGSNMFFKTKHLIAIDGFDETFPNTTDRELLIRFLKYCQENELIENITVITKFGVRHYNHLFEKVNTNLALKQKGLDLFYKKYRSQFTEDDYQQSVARAITFFKYKPVT